MTRKTVDFELFGNCGGIGEGFRRAGVEFDVVVEINEVHCTSYEKNLGHRPIRVDVHDLLRLVRSGGWSVNSPIRSIVADPPCQPFPRAGKRMGECDERDCLQATCDVIRELQPRSFLIGNVPGLCDRSHFDTLQRTIGSLTGYCIDHIKLDAANYGVPQNRIRPFWFGHRGGPCIQWPEPSHCDPESINGNLTIPGVQELLPWVTCQQALGHLTGKDLGRQIRLRLRGQKKSGESALTVQPDKHPSSPDKHPSSPDKPSKTLTGNTHGEGSIVVKPAPTIGAKQRSQGAQVIAWPWDRPSTTVQQDGRLAPPGHHDEFSIMSMPGAVQISEKAAAILQGFPEGWVFAGKSKAARWAQIGMAMPPPLAHAVALAMVRQWEKDEAEVAAHAAKQDSLRLYDDIRGQWENRS